MTVIANEPQTAPHPKRKGKSASSGSADDVPGITRPMTYEEYLASPEEMRRYDIIDGYKRYRMYGPEGNQLPNPTRLHQRIQKKLGRIFEDFEIGSGAALFIPPPCDVFITDEPRLRMRQPDLLLISRERLAENPPEDNPTPLAPAPELVVEILSPSDRPSVLAAKIADYRSVDVREAWVIRSGPQTVEVVALSQDEILPVRTYITGEIVESLAFPGLTVPVDAVFAE